MTNKCRTCGDEYETISIRLMGVSFNNGLCPKCQKVALDKFNEQERMTQAAEIAKKRRDWRETCGIPPRFMDKDFSGFDKERQPTAYKKAVAYAENYPLLQPKGYASLLMYSDNAWGVGKTHLACSVLHRILDRWQGENIARPGYFITEPDLFRSIQATYSLSSEERRLRESEDDIITRLTTVRLLILDDVGKEERSDPRFVQRVLFAVINGRYNRMLPTVLTANLSPERLEKYLGGAGTNEASFERLVEMCGGKFLRLKGESYRRK